MRGNQLPATAMIAPGYCSHRARRIWETKEVLALPMAEHPTAARVRQTILAAERPDRNVRADSGRSVACVLDSRRRLSAKSAARQRQAGRRSIRGGQEWHAPDNRYAPNSFEACNLESIYSQRPQ